MSRSRREGDGPSVGSMDPEPKLVKVDSGQRVSLGRLAYHQHYLVSDGRIVRTPAVGPAEILDYRDDVRARILGS